MLVAVYVCVLTSTVIELDLRLPSMVRGRPLFNRMVYAFDNVLSDTLTWLFYDKDVPFLTQPIKSAEVEPIMSEKLPESAAAAIATGQADKQRPIYAHQPFIRHIDIESRPLPRIKTPWTFPAVQGQIDEPEVLDLLEWIQLAMQGSPRLSSEDDMDLFLSRYAVPCFTAINAPEESRTCTAQDLTRLRITAFMPAQLLAKVIAATLTSASDSWAAVRVQRFDSTSYTLFARDNTCMLWHCD